MKKENIIKIIAGLCLVLAGVLFLLGKGETGATDGDTISIVQSSAVETESQVESSSETVQTTKYDDGLVNINTADESELKTLNGIGTARAAAIISYRETNGLFASKEDIMNVPGIKEASYEKIKDYIKVDG